MCLILTFPEENVEKGGEGKNTIFGLCVHQFWKMTFSKFVFLIANFVEFVLLPCIEIIGVLKQFYLKTPFILNRK